MLFNSWKCKSLALFILYIQVCAGGTSFSKTRGDEIVLERLDRVALSQARMETRDLGPDARCAKFGEMLRRMLGDMAPVSKQDLFTVAIDALNLVKAHPDNPQPVVTALDECLALEIQRADEHEIYNLKGTGNGVVDRISETVAGGVKNGVEDLRKFDEELERKTGLASREIHHVESDLLRKADKIHDKVAQVKDGLSNLTEKVVDDTLASATHNLKGAHGYPTSHSNYYDGHGHEHGLHNLGDIANTLGRSRKHGRTHRGGHRLPHDGYYHSSKHGGHHDPSSKVKVEVEDEKSHKHKVKTSMIGHGDHVGAHGTHGAHGTPGIVNQVINGLGHAAANHLGHNVNSLLPGGHGTSYGHHDGHTVFNEPLVHHHEIASLLKGRIHASEDILSQCHRYYYIFTLPESVTMNVIETVAHMPMDRFNFHIDSNMYHKLREVERLLAQSPSGRAREVANQLDYCLDKTEPGLTGAYIAPNHAYIPNYRLHHEYGHHNGHHIVDPYGHQHAHYPTTHHNSGLYPTHSTHHSNGLHHNGLGNHGVGGLVNHALNHGLGGHGSGAHGSGAHGLANYGVGSVLNHALNHGSGVHGSGVHGSGTHGLGNHGVGSVLNHAINHGLGNHGAVTHGSGAHGHYGVGSALNHAINHGLVNHGHGVGHNVGHGSGLHYGHSTPYHNQHHSTHHYDPTHAVHSTLHGGGHHGNYHGNHHGNVYHHGGPHYNHGTGHGHYNHGTHRLIDTDSDSDSDSDFDFDDHHGHHSHSSVHVPLPPIPPVAPMPRMSTFY